jgi:site-specific DNA recombinase
LLIDDLRRRGVVTRVRTLATGRIVGGVPFKRGPLAYLLKNRMYLGELNHGVNSYPGAHQPMVAREVFDAVQAKLAAQAAAVGYRRSRTEALLTGKLYDRLGRPMTPSYAVKGGVRYCYYISCRTTEPAEGSAAPILRLPAPDVEKAIVEALTRGGRLEGTSEIVSANGLDPKAQDFEAGQIDAIRDLLERVDVSATRIEIRLAERPAETSRPSTIIGHSHAPARCNRCRTALDR